MVLDFKYKSVKHRDGTFSRVPLIPITLVGKEIIKTYGVVDSGADDCALPNYLAELLGLSLSGRKERSFGIGGFVDSVETRVIIIIEQGNEKYRFNIPLRVILSPHNPPVILGQEGFFDKFIINFNKRENTFSLKKT